MTLQLRLSRFPGEPWVCGVHSSPHSRTEYRATPEFRRLSGQSGDKMPESFSTTQRTLRDLSARRSSCPARIHFPMNADTCLSALLPLGPEPRKFSASGFPPNERTQIWLT